MLNKHPPYIMSILRYSCVEFNKRSTNIDELITRIYLVCFLMMCHTSRRLYECIFISIYSSDAKTSKISISHLILGYTYYIMLGLSLISAAPQIDRWKKPIFRMNFNHLMGFNILFGVGLFVLANISQFKCHTILANLRKDNKDKIINRNSYFIPRGFLFEYVTCPHYFCEILIYISTCLILVGNYGYENYSTFLTWYLASFFVVTNQICAAIMQHDWSIKKFGAAYPTNRKAIIPFVI
ncbi:polyprenol reductase-like isoform X1 [Gordionus sp. m RMFG-2023]|uniref:polyprenol reductase-like isoform X1 n=1 Tax=Gordionus sp. m RMFG-2023 TaxID=3053472 RepID=UPI0031FD0816